MSLETWTSAGESRPDYYSKIWREAGPRGSSGGVAGGGRSRGRSPARSLGQNLACALYVALALYCLLSALFGQGGLIAYRKLEDRVAAMEANLSLLGEKRASLSAELEALKSDPERAALEARGLGYLRKGENEVILGERVERAESLDSGTVLPYAQPGGVSDSALKEMAFGAFLAMLAFLCAPRRKGMRAGPPRRRSAAD